MHTSYSLFFARDCPRGKFELSDIHEVFCREWSPCVAAFVITVDALMELNSTVNISVEQSYLMVDGW